MWGGDTGGTGNVDEIYLRNGGFKISDTGGSPEDDSDFDEEGRRLAHIVLPLPMVNGYICPRNPPMRF